MSKNKLFVKDDLLMYNHHGHNLVVAPSEIRSEILNCVLDILERSNTQTSFEKFLVALFISRNSSVCFGV